MRYLIGLVLLSAVAPALCAEIYECATASGSLRYTNIKSEAKGCKLLIVLSPDAVPTSQPQTKPVAVPLVAEPMWLAVAYGNAESGSRLQALEDWARGSRETLDPVTYALVDPDESVRARAQELMEQVWTTKVEGR